MSSVPVAVREISEQESASISNENAKRILAFLRQSKKKINWSGFHNVILIVGNTGSGKTTLARFLAGDNRDLVSYEVGKGLGEFMIRDNDGTISFGSTVISKTTYPEIYVGEENNDIYVDLTGFGDVGRNEAYDVGAACFIKEVIEKAAKVKIILTVNHSSVRKGVSRNDFPQLLECVSILFKNIDNYRSSVALIVTKVDRYSVPDSVVIENVADFLIEFKESIEIMRNSVQIYSSECKREENEIFFRNYTLLVNSLLEKNDTGYTRLGLFKRPNVAGLVSEIQPMRENKSKLKTMININLEYVRPNVADIGYPISFKSKYIVRDLADEINENVKYNFAELRSKLICYYGDFISNLSHDKEALKHHLAASSVGLDRIRHVDESTNIVDLASHIRINLTEPCKQIAESLIDNIAILGKFLNFLGELCARNFNSCSKEWIRSLEAAITLVESSLDSVSQMIRESTTSFFDWIIERYFMFHRMVQEILKKVIDSVGKIFA